MLNMATEGPEGTEGKILRDSYLGGQSPELPHHQGGFAKSVCQRDGEMNAALQRKHNPSGTEAPVMSQVLGQLLYNDAPHSLPCSLLSTGEGASLREQSSSCRSTEPVPPRQTDPGRPSPLTDRCHFCQVPKCERVTRSLLQLFGQNPWEWWCRGVEVQNPLGGNREKAGDQMVEGVKVRRGQRGLQAA